MTKPLQLDVYLLQVDTHDKEGKRERYFADDDRYDLKEMVRREKMRTAEDHNAMMARLSSKVSKLKLTVTMHYSRSSPCDHSRKRQPFELCNENSHKRPLP